MNHSPDSTVPTPTTAALYLQWGSSQLEAWHQRSGCMISYVGSNSLVASTIFCQSWPDESSSTSAWLDNIKKYNSHDKFLLHWIVLSITHCFVRNLENRQCDDCHPDWLRWRKPAPCDTTEKVVFFQLECQHSSCDNVKLFLARKAWDCHATSLECDTRRDDAWESVNSHLPSDFVILTHKKFAKIDSHTSHSAQYTHCSLSS